MRKRESWFLRRVARRRATRMQSQTDRNAGPHKRLPQRNEKRTGRGHCKTQGRRRAHRRATGPPPRGSEGKSQVRCRQGEKGGRGMLLGEEVSAVSAALGAAVVCRTMRACWLDDARVGARRRVARKAHKMNAPNAAPGTPTVHEGRASSGQGPGGQTRSRQVSRQGRPGTTRVWGA